MPDTRSDRRVHALAVWAALLVTVLWSSSWILIRFGLDDEDLPPITFAGLRYGLAAAVLIGWVASRRTHRSELRRLDRATFGRLAVLGVVYYAVTQGAQFVAIDNQPAASTSLVLAMTTLVVAMVGARSLDEAASPRQILGAFVTVFGAWLYFGGDLGATTIGMIAACVALMANVTSSLLGRSANRDHTHSPVVITAVSMAIGAALLLVTGVIVDGVPVVTPRAAALIAWLAVINTAFAFTLWNLSLRRLSAVESSGINTTMLVQIAVLAWIFLGEQPGLRGIVGIVVVSLGIFFTQSVPGAPGTGGRPRPERVTPDE